MQIEAHILGELLLFSRRGKIFMQQYTAIKLKTNYVLEQKVLFFVDKKWLRTKEKGHLVGYFMMCYTASYMPFKMAAEQLRTTTLTDTRKACLVLNHPY